MKQREFRLHPVAIAALLAVIGALTGWATTARADTAPATSSSKTVHTAEGDKPKATTAIKKARSTRASLRGTKDEMEATRKTQRR